MVKNLFVSAICAGIAAGLLASVLQFTFVIPVLLEGEL
jgi:predicted cobalt transporter CbtA